MTRLLVFVFIASTTLAINAFAEEEVIDLDNPQEEIADDHGSTPIQDKFVKPQEATTPKPNPKPAPKVQPLPQKLETKTTNKQDADIATKSEKPKSTKKSTKSKKSKNKSKSSSKPK